jgi:hypothetical protein
LQEIVQELSCRPDERFPLLVFMETRGFPHKHHRRVRTSHAKHDLSSAHLCELTTLAVMQRLAEFEEGHDGEIRWFKCSRDFRRADFSCQWMRNVGSVLICDEDIGII